MASNKFDHEINKLNPLFAAIAFEADVLKTKQCGYIN